jgi:Predicted Zn-dependent protease (DUF2268)
MIDSSTIMKKLFACAFILASALTVFNQKISPNRHYQEIPFDGSKEAECKLDLEKNATYLITVFQKDIDVEVHLLNAKNQQVAFTDLADGNNGYDKLEYRSETNATYKLLIKAFSNRIIPTGLIKIKLERMSDADLKRRKIIAAELEPENTKMISTADIKHFWEAYDKLKFSKSDEESLDIIQKTYLDRATNGLKEFQKVRYFSAEFFLERIKKYKKFYESVRGNTLLPFQMENISDSINDFKRIYPAAKDIKISFVVGPMSSGGTISNNYLLIGIEMIAGDKSCDVSEIENENLKSDILSRSTKADVTEFIRETIVHEYIHTQQKKIDKDALECTLLQNVLNEGIASFIAEKIIMKRDAEIANRAAVYATENEKALWQELKGNLCSKDLSRWLYNASAIKDRPGDLGYRTGYKIAESYYKNAQNKTAAIKEMIEMDNSLTFLDKSKYDLKFR